MSLTSDEWHRRFTQQALWTSDLRRYIFDQINITKNQRILEVGCGTGAQTLALAFATGGAIVATDLVSAFLSRLRETASETGLGPRIRIIAADMGRLPFADGSFDLIWSEGAAYVLGFDNALSQWRSLVRPGGYLVVSELCWFRSDPPAEIRDFWESHYPAMRDVEANLAAVSNAGWICVGHFHLPPFPLVDEAADFKGRGVVAGQVPEEKIQGKAGVDDVFHHQHMAVLDGQFHVFGYMHFSGGFGAGAVAHEADKVHFHGKLQGPGQIRHKYEGPFEDAH